MPWLDTNRIYVEFGCHLPKSGEDGAATFLQRRETQGPSTRAPSQARVALARDDDAGFRLPARNSKPPKSGEGGAATVLRRRETQGPSTRAPSQARVALARDDNAGFRFPARNSKPPKSGEGGAATVLRR